MVGRASLMVIIGFSFIFGIAGQYWNRTSNRAVENLWSYDETTAAHELALSAAYILADTIFWIQGDASAMGHLKFQTRHFGPGADYSLWSQNVLVDGDSCILATARGAYQSSLAYEGGAPDSLIDTVQILLKPTRFCQYAFFTGDDNGVYWQSGDTLNGAYHTNTQLCIDGHPQFNGSVSTGTGLKAYWNGSGKVVTPTQLPDSYGDKLLCVSYENGDIIKMPSSLLSYNTIPQTTKFSNSDTHAGYAYDVYFTFSSTDPTKVGFHTQLSSVSGTTVTAIAGGRVPASGDSTVSITAFGNAGGQGLGSVVIVQNGDIHISGVMDGKVTFVAQQANTSGGDPARVSSSAFYNSGSGNYDCYGANGNHNNGNIIVEGNTTYSSNTTDLLGLTADNSIEVKTGGLNSSSVTNISGALFARQGKIFAQNYGNGTSMGKLNIFGALAQNVRGPVGLVGGASGFTKYYSFDGRLSHTLTSPPYSPSSGGYNILSWLE